MQYLTFRASLQVRGMWPYWMDVSSQEPVPNDIDSMDSLYLLTGTSRLLQSAWRYACPVPLTLDSNGHHQ